MGITALIIVAVSGLGKLGYFHTEIFSCSVMCSRIEQEQIFTVASTGYENLQY
jgi:hypothetical protein